MNRRSLPSTLRSVGGALRASWQGILGAACVAAGVYELAGSGWALVCVGVFFLIGSLGDGR